MINKRFSAWGDLALLGLVFIGATLVAGAFMLGLGGNLDRGPMLFAVYVLQFTVAVACGYFVLRARGGMRLRFAGGWADGPLVVLGVVVVTALGVVLEPLIALFPDHYLETLNNAIGRGGWAIATTVVAAPVLEEIFFRGLVLERLTRRWPGWVAVVASSALFGLAHAPILPQMVNAFAVAVVMGYLYLQSRSLIVVIVIHAINNGVAYLLLTLLGTQTPDTREIIGNDAVYWSIFAISALVVVVSLVALHRATHRRTKS